MNDPPSSTDQRELDSDAALLTIAHLIDDACDLADAALANQALRLADDLEGRTLPDDRCALLDYFRANAWAACLAAVGRDRQLVWAWHQPEIEKQIFLLRRARYSPGFEALPILRRCQILTNLANQLDTVGRFIEARAAWSEALNLEPRFWMASGNRGRGLMHYSKALFDPGHQAVFALHAHRDLIATLANIEAHPESGDARLFELFAKSAAEIGASFDVDLIERDFRPDDHPLGRSRREQAYRRRCLGHTLFLNPLNDACRKAIAAQDVLTLPTFSTALGEPPVLIGFFNQLKQEFASARWLYFEATSESKPHLSDKGVLLLNTLDYPAYGLSVEKVKVAYRMAYSLLDKIAYFLNRYFKLGVRERDVSFRSIWFEKKSGAIRHEFEDAENWPLRGLFWLSKDLFEPEMRETTDPDARRLKELRDHLEHKYVKVHDFGLPPPSARAVDPFFDHVAYSISRQQLESSTLHILKLARSAIIYLALGMHREERRRDAGKQPSLAGVMEVGTYRDEWKR